MSDDHEDRQRVPESAMPGGESFSPASSTPWRGVDTDTLREQAISSTGDDSEREARRFAAPADERFPASTARAITAAALVGALALSVHEPLLGVAALVGILSGPAVPRFTGGLRSVTAGAVVLPAAAVGLVAAVALAAQTDAGLGLSALGLVVGCAVVALRTDVERDNLQQFGFLALLAGVVVGVTAVFAYGGALAGGLGLFLGDAAGIFPPNALGFLTWFVSAALAIVLALVAVPPAMVSTTALPRSMATTDGQRQRVVRRKLLAGVVLVPALSVLSFAGTFLLGVPGPSRLLLLVCTLLFTTVALVGVLARQSWETVGDTGQTEPILRWIRSDRWQTAGRETNPIVGAVTGLVVGSLAALVFASGTAGVSEPAPTVFGLAAGLLFVGGLAGVTYARLASDLSLPAPATVIAVALGGGVVVAELLRAGEESVLVFDLASLGTVVAVAAAAFVYSVGTHGRTLAHEVGASGVTRQPQLVWLGWHAVVGGVGVLAALLLFWLSGSVSLVLSTPARVGLATGFVALAALTVLLLRR